MTHEVQERLRAGFDMERRRLDELLEGVAALKQRRRGPGGTGRLA